ncbi:hypothetical protein CFOL_v3_34481 [Cephalotus follicularis]|uniref:Uncharacterized protein n=1 Tax=Cephalotus follicularis TaxID=3775 RepID=A0A1Q3DF60_CEPFO|nr:hypothetical protein CFOL_v3_34481 [Cephalotus follicularis]
MKLSFGKSSMDFNIFRLGKHQSDFDDVYVSIPDTIDSYFNIDFDRNFRREFEVEEANQKDRLTWLENEEALMWLENKLNEPNSNSEWDHLSHYTHKIATPDETYFDKDFDNNFMECLREFEELEVTQKEILSWLDDGIINFFSDSQWLVGHDFCDSLYGFYWWRSCWDGSKIVQIVFSHCVCKVAKIGLGDAFECFCSLNGFYWWKSYWNDVYIVSWQSLRFVDNVFHCYSSLDGFYWWRSCCDCSYIVKIVLHVVCLRLT